ncbi:MAG: hypothetical protein QXJ75_03455 [Candidatus Bathyarchaeia archaeon]
MAVLEKLGQEHKDVLEKLSLLGVTIQGLEIGKVDHLKKKVGTLENIDELSDFFKEGCSLPF